VRFYFDLACPFCYLAAERVDRLFDAVTWVPACSSLLRQQQGPLVEVDAGWAARERAEQRAAELRMPLVWPARELDAAQGIDAGHGLERTRSAAMRAAAHAADHHRGADFVLAAGRMAFCGGFDLEDPEVLAEVAAAARVPLEDCLRAAGDPAYDAVLAGTSRQLVADGCKELPALRVGQTLFSGERRLAEAAAAAAALERGRLQAPVPG